MYLFRATVAFLFFYAYNFTENKISDIILFDIKW